MAKYKYNLEISAQDEKEADKKINALAVLGQKLSAEELEKLAHIVKNEPGKLAMARAYLKL